MESRIRETGEPDDAKVSRQVRRGAVGKGEGSSIHLAGSLPNYIASWARDIAVVRRNLAAIQQTAHRLIVIIGEGHSIGNDQQEPR